VNKRQLNNGSWTKAANDRAFECAVLPRVFEIFYDGVNDCGAIFGPLPAHQGRNRLIHLHRLFQTECRSSWLYRARPKDEVWDEFKVFTGVAIWPSP
jgi:hypothetical protein